MPVIFSDFLVSNEMSGYTENNSTTIFIVHELFLSYKLFKVYRNNMDHPVWCLYIRQPTMYFKKCSL